MLRAVIADDENKICILIQKLVDWDALGIEVCGTACNGPEAFSLIERVRPDIVITDIRMPGFDGIELIERAQACGIKTRFIIISGFREFEYAHKALAHRVSAYLLKPINKDELTSTLKKLTEEIREEDADISQKGREPAEGGRLALEDIPGVTVTASPDSIRHSVTTWLEDEIDRRSRENDNENISIRLAKQYIEEHYAEPISLEEVASVVHLNPFYLSAAFKREEGINFNKFVVSVRMEAAKALLRGNDMNIAQVGEAVGYRDAKHFRKLFLQEVGIRPSEYRKLYC